MMEKVGGPGWRRIKYGSTAIDSGSIKALIKTQLKREIVKENSHSSSSSLGEQSRLLPGIFLCDPPIKNSFGAFLYFICHPTTTNLVPFGIRFKLILITITIAALAFALALFLGHCGEVNPPPFGFPLSIKLATKWWQRPQVGLRTSSS